MAKGIIRNYGFGVEGVNLVADKLKLKDGEATQLQNAELVPDEDSGGLGALTMRGGLAELTGSAMSGSVLGIFGWPLKTTYVKTLHVARETEDANTFLKTTNGTSWTDISTPLAPVADAKFSDNTNVQTARRHVSFKNFLVYPGNGYTKNSENPTIVSWDGTDAYVVTNVPIGPSSNGNPPFVITDMLTVKDKIYIAISDPGGSAPDRPGRVLELDLVTGRMRQVASSFGGGTGEVSGGAPACLCWYLNQLWVGLNGETTTNGIGKVVRCFPGVDTSWTTDTSTLVSHVTSLTVFKGALYAATRASVSGGATISKRSVTAGTWATVVTSASGAGGSGHYAALTVYSGSLYAVAYFATTPVIHIVTSSDGASWSTSRDVDSADSGIAGNLPASGLVYDGNLYFGFRSTTASGVDGFVMRYTGSAWTKALTDNINGALSVLTERS